MNRYPELNAVSRRFGEYHDCGVITLAVVTNSSYDKAHDVLKRLGRTNHGPTKHYLLLDAITKMGYLVQDQSERWRDNDVKTVITAQRILPAFNTYVISTNRHVMGYHGGIVHDWAANTRQRIRSVTLVYKARELKQL